MSYYKKMVGEHLYLSPIDSGEVDMYLRWMNDPAVAVQFGTFPQNIRSKDDLPFIYEQPKDMQRYGIVLHYGDELIGSISLQNIDYMNQNAYLDIFVGSQRYRGKGYGVEAIRLLLNYGFQTLNLHNIMLTVHADNEAGLACFHKSGFQETGRLKEWIYKNGGFVDKLYMGITKQEFFDKERQE